MDALSLRTRSASEIADAAINLFKANGRLFLVISAIMMLPVMILIALFYPSAAQTPGDGAALAGSLLAIIAALWAAVISGALHYAASERYLGRPVTASDAIRAAVGRSPRLVLGLMGRGLLIGFGSLLLLVGGVFAFIFSFAMMPIIMIEKAGVNAAWMRSRELARGLKAHILGTLVIAYLVYFIVFITVGFMFGMMLFGENARALQLLQQGITIFITPFVACTEVVLYYDARIRKEGFDIEHMARSLDASVPVMQP